MIAIGIDEVFFATEENERKRVKREKQKIVKNKKLKIK